MTASLPLSLPWLSLLPSFLSAIFSWPLSLLPSLLCFLHSFLPSLLSLPPSSFLPSSAFFLLSFLISSPTSSFILFLPSSFPSFLGFLFFSLPYFLLFAPSAISFFYSPYVPFFLGFFSSCLPSTRPSFLHSPLSFILKSFFELLSHTLPPLFIILCCLYHPSTISHFSIALVSQGMMVVPQDQQLEVLASLLLQQMQMPNYKVKE